MLAAALGGCWGESEWSEPFQRLQACVAGMVCVNPCGTAWKLSRSLHLGAWIARAATLLLAFIFCRYLAACFAKLLTRDGAHGKAVSCPETQQACACCYCIPPCCTACILAEHMWHGQCHLPAHACSACITCRASCPGLPQHTHMGQVGIEHIPELTAKARRNLAQDAALAQLVTDGAPLQLLPAATVSWSFSAHDALIALTAD